MNNIKMGDKIKVHMYDLMHDRKEIKTRCMNNVYDVYKKNGKLGIDFNEVGSVGYKANGDDTFSPLDAFATKTGAVKFEKVGDVNVNGI